MGLSLQFLLVVGWCFLASHPPFGPVPVSSQAAPPFGDTNTLNSSSTDFVCGSQCELRQRAALRQLYQETNLDGTWINSTGWDGKIDSHFCYWHGVFCCPPVFLGMHYHPSYVAPHRHNSSESSCNGGVRALVLSRNGLTGELPVQSLVNLNSSVLLQLDLDFNALYGTLPPALAQLTSLRDLRISYNQLSGSIPDVWREMADLSILRLSGNNLTGSVPFDYFSNLANLRMMDIMRNKLTGSPPLELTSLPQFESLVGCYNEFNAPLPNIEDTSGELHAVGEVDLSHNYIPGTLPSMLGSANLYILDLSANHLTGSIPEVYGRIHGLILNHNNLNGSLVALPSPYTGLLYLSHNQLTGSLCADCFAVAQRLGYFDISSNMGITGPLQTSTPFIRQLDISYTSMSAATLKTEWLMKDSPSGVSNDWVRGVPEFAICPSKNIPGSVKGDAVLILSPSYYYYQGCACGMKGTAQTVPLYTPADLNGFYTTMQCVVPLPPPPPSKKSHFPWWSLIIVVVGILTLAGILIGFFHKRVSQLLASKRALNSKKRPPGLGKKSTMVTLVITDVEASTELWEWDPPGSGIMSAALDIHDRALRRTLAAYYGYEVTTEGDAFINAFHEPLDAVAWCLATQVELLNAAWPPRLLEHPKAMQVLSMPSTSTPVNSARPPTTPVDSPPVDHDSAMSPNWRRGIYVGISKGLLAGLGRGRLPGSMRSTTPISTKSSMRQPQPALIRGLRVRMGVASGQCDSIRVHKVTQRTEYWGLVYRRAAAISDLPAGGQVLTDSATFHGINGDLALLKSMLEENGHAVDGQLDRGSLDDTHLSAILDTATSRSSAEPSQFRSSEGRELSFTSRRGSIFFDRESRQCDLKSQGDRQDTKASKGSQGGCMVIDCGNFDLATGCESLTQVMPPGLEKRACFFPTLEASLHLTPGYFDAPCTSVVCQPREPHAVTLVFCALQGYRGMVDDNRDLAQQVLSLYNTIIRRSLLATGGYECQELQGSYMIAFHSSTDALEWCLMVQEIIYEVHWTEAMMALPNMINASQEHRFSGPSVNMGVYTGVPTKVTPHSTTGRADYFGPLVNRAARLCHGAAYGGQVVISRNVLTNLMSLWSLPEDKALPPPPRPRKIRSLSSTSSPSAMLAQLASASVKIRKSHTYAIAGVASSPISPDRKVSGSGSGRYELEEVKCPEMVDADMPRAAQAFGYPDAALSTNDLQQIHEEQASEMSDGRTTPSTTRSSGSSKNVPASTSAIYWGAMPDLPIFVGLLRQASHHSQDSSSQASTTKGHSVAMIGLKSPLCPFGPRHTRFHSASGHSPNAHHQPRLQSSISVGNAHSASGFSTDSKLQPSLRSSTSVGKLHSAVCHVQEDMASKAGRHSAVPSKHLRLHSADGLTTELKLLPSLPLKWPVSEPGPPASRSQLEILPEADRCNGSIFNQRANGQAIGFLEDGIWVFLVNIDNMKVKESRWKMPNESALKASSHHTMESTVHEPSVSKFDSVLKEMISPIKRLLTRSRPQPLPPAVTELSVHLPPASPFSSFIPAPAPIASGSAPLSPFSSFLPAPISSNFAHLGPFSSFPTPVLSDNDDTLARHRSTPLVHLEMEPLPPCPIQAGYSSMDEPSFRNSSCDVATKRDGSGLGGEEGAMDRSSHPDISPLQHVDRAIRARTAKNKWLWTGSVIIRDMGTFAFKGLSDDQQVFSVMTRSTRDKPCMSKSKSAKSTQLKAGKGVVCEMRMSQKSMDKEQCSYCGHHTILGVCTHCE